MKKAKTPAPINLPYASTVASFYGDQKAVEGNSFLGRMFRGRGQSPTITQGGRPATGAGSASPVGATLNSMMYSMIGAKQPNLKPQAPAAAPRTTSSFLSGMVK